MEPFLNSGGAFRPQIVKVGALSAPTKELLLKYSLDLPYAQSSRLRPLNLSPSQIRTCGFSAYGSS